MTRKSKRKLRLWLALLFVSLLVLAAAGVVAGWFTRSGDKAPGIFSGTWAFS